MKAKLEFCAATRREIRIPDFLLLLESLRGALGVLIPMVALVAAAGEPATDFSGANSLSPPTLLDNTPSDRVQTVIKQVLREPQVDKRLQRLSELSASLSLSEVPEALKAADSLSELRERIVLRQTALLRWGELSPADAFAHLAKLPESQWKANTIRDLAAKYAAKDVEHAAAAAVAMSAGASRNDTITLIANVWAQTNVNAALAWAERLPAGFSKESALDAVRYVWVHSDPVAASGHIAKLPPGQTKNDFIANVAFEWTVRDQLAALRWANSLPDGPDKETALVNIAESWANQDPWSAAAFALKLPAGELRAKAGAMVAGRWARQYPCKAADWAWNCGDSGIQQRGVRAVLEVWAGVDPAGCSQWVEHLPADANRDQTIRAFVAVTTMWTPDLATRDALLIESDRLRMDALNECLPRWQEVDLTAFTNWLQHAPWPDSQKAVWEKAAATR